VKYYVSWAGRTVPVELREAVPGVPGEYDVIIEGATHRVQLAESHTLVDGKVIPCAVDAKTGRAHFRPGSAPFTLTTVDPATVSLRGAAQRPDLRAPMPGKIVEVRVTEGAVVESGRCLAVIEAMKMQNELSVPFDAKITRVHATVGQAVESGALLLELEAETPTGEPSVGEGTSSDERPSPGSS
jgi:glutaconyl-CoA/methylmalonyl-CoA decarboxylase subunit gamma